LNSTMKNLMFWMVAALLIMLFWSVSSRIQQKEKQLTFSDFMEQVDRGSVAEVTITGSSAGSQIVGTLKNGDPIRTFAPPQYVTLVDKLLSQGVEVSARDANGSSVWAHLINWTPIIIMIAFLVFFMRQMQGSGNRALSFGKSKAKLSSTQQKKVTFKDVAGIDEAKEELEEIIDFLKEPQKFQKLGGRIPKGVLLMGPPGTGKTLLARAISGEANVPFFTISGSDFVEMFVGVGASRVRDLFEQGKKNAPCIVFIDEIDAVGRHRGAGLGGGHDEREQTLNQLLVEMDGFESNEGVILIAATNRPDVLDPALLRPGRFDRRVVVSLPDVKGREGILKVHTNRIPLASDVDLSILARGTPGFSGADLANLVNEAALNAARYGRKAVGMRDFENSKDKVLMGAERRSMIMSESEKRTTAYHEAGHALVAALLPDADPIHKVTIIPRGMALGVTQLLPQSERYSHSQVYLEAMIAVKMGGRIAEELILNQITSGAHDDLERATDLARRMVCEWGMSERLGPMTFGRKEEQIFLGRDIVNQPNYSADTAIKIDEEVTRIVERNYQRAKDLLTTNRHLLERIAKSLLEREVLDAEEVKMVMEGIPLKERVAASSETTPEKKAESKGEKKAPLTPAILPEPKSIPQS